MAKRPLPSPEQLRQLLDYYPETGLLFWRPRTGKWSKRWNTLHAGKMAGTIDAHGYRALKLFDKTYLAHRVIWAMIHGYWPEQLDHRNGKRADNRLRNLRDVPQVVNQRNQGRHRSNKSGRTGVCWGTKRQCWLAYIKVNDVQIALGGFPRFEDAVEARASAERKYGFTGRQ